MKESLKQYWIYFLAFVFLILGVFYYSKAYGYEALTFEHQELESTTTKSLTLKKKNAKVRKTQRRKEWKMKFHIRLLELQLRFIRL
jgi:hypothetical protein